ncbi:AbfB domain-containing protein [Streptomyces tanashiensis]|uniref:AbfB domain-containing protein n=1 Tax=Streptomyces tanashiensis TaxID=67367 RepID=UPI003413D1A4
MSSSFQSFNYQDRYIRHANFLGELTPIQSDLDQSDATFYLTPGLAGEGVSFESKNFPNRYLRHQGFRIKLHEGPRGYLGSPPPESDEMKLMRRDATFRQVQGLASPDGWVSFESINFPNHYIRHSEFHLFLAPIRGELDLKDATFAIRDGFIPDPPIH